jgi:hypothetical protein
MKHVINISQKEEWVSYVRRSVNVDFYHTWNYHTLHVKEGTALLFVCEDKDDFIAIPLLKRSIPNSNYFDMGSVYGYGGPFSTRAFAELSETLITLFKANLLDFLRQENIISVFSRLHPFFDQGPLINGFEGVVDNGKVVALDLMIPLEDQRQQYQERSWRKIKQLRNKGYYVAEGHTSADIKFFEEIYTSNMLRIEAADYYLFDEAYFTQLLQSDEYDARLLFVYNEAGYPICGAIIVLTNQIIQAHLLGTRAEYLQDSPAKLLLDEVALLGRREGMKYYNLGGGLGFKEDSLFKWKSSFSDLTFEYKSWRFIVDHDAYNSLLTDMEIDHDSDVDFFPLYRLQRQTI